MLKSLKLRAKDIECPVCHAMPDENCKDADGHCRAPHVERARCDRWSKMGVTVWPS